MSRHRGRVDHRAEREARVAQVLRGVGHLRDPAAGRRPLAAGRRGRARAARARRAAGGRAPHRRRGQEGVRGRGGDAARHGNAHLIARRETMRLTRSGARGWTGRARPCWRRPSRDRRRAPTPADERRARGDARPERRLRRHGGRDRRSTRRTSPGCRRAELRWTWVNCPDDAMKVGCGHALGRGDPPALRPRDRAAGRSRRSRRGAARERGRRLPVPRQRLRVDHLGPRRSSSCDRASFGMSIEHSYSQNAYVDGLWGVTAALSYRPNPHVGLLGGRARLQRAESGARPDALAPASRAAGARRALHAGDGAPADRAARASTSGSRCSTTRAPTTGCRGARSASTCPYVGPRLRERRDRAPAQRQRARRARHRGARAALRRTDRGRRRALRQRLRRGRRAST